MKDKVLNSIAIIGFLVFVAMPLLAGCKAVHEPLQGLCYTDERGTYKRTLYRSTKGDF